VWRLVGDPPLTPRLLDLVRSRLGGLETGHRRALELVALGEPVPRVALERLTAPRVLEELEREGVIVTERLDDTWSVRTAHPILGEAVRADLPEGARVRLLEVLAEGLGATLERRTDLVRIAELRLAASSPIAPEVLVAAATEARRLCLHDRAERLAAAAETTGAGPEATVIRAQALSALGRHQEAARALSNVDGSELPQQLAASALAVEVGAADLRGHWFTQVMELLDRAAHWHTGEAWKVTIATLRIAILVRSGRYRDAIELGAPLAGAVEAGEDDVLETGVALGPIVAEALLAVGRSSDALRAVRETPSTVQPGPTALLGWARVRLRTGRAWDEVEATATESHRRSLAAGDPAAATVAGTVLGRLALARGRPLTAIRWLSDATVELGDTDPYGTLVPSLSALACAQAIAGSDPSLTLDRLAAARDERPSGACDDIDMARAHGWAAAATGEVTRARQLVLTAAASTEGAITEEAFLLHDALRLGGPSAEVDARLRELAGMTDNPLVELFAAHAHGAARDDGGALESVASSYEAQGADLWAAEAWSAAAGAYRREGRAGSAQRAATRSWAFAERCEGAVTPSLSQSDEAIVLSLREREVAALAARGVPNARIAERLSLSVRTVESHVYRAMTKLGVRHRDELGAVLGVESRV
jgi:DNA-binding CsgD family transcriptional regulator